MIPRRTAALIIAIFLAMSCVEAQASEIRWVWSAPDTGGAAHGYEFQINTNVEGWISFFVEECELVVDMPDGTSICRVRAWNLDGLEQRQYGEWSPPSLPYTQVPPPGGCNAPQAMPVEP